MSSLFTKAPFVGRAEKLLLNPDRQTGLEKQAVADLMLLFSGIAGDCHGGLTVASDSRLLGRYRRGTEVRNARQLSLVSSEELGDIAAALGVTTIEPEWMGANLVTSGIPDLTLLPPSTRLQFPSNATICIDIENLPCRYTGEAIAKHHPGIALEFVKAATNKRGVVAWVEREGLIRSGDAITLWLPPQRYYVHADQLKQQAAE